MNTRTTKELLAQHSGWWCYYCGIALIATDMLGEIPNDLIALAHYPNLDHRIPKAHGGSDAPENLVLTCKRCNSRKGTSTVEAYRARLAAEAPRPLSPAAPVHVPAMVFALLPQMGAAELRLTLVLVQADAGNEGPLTIDDCMARTGLGRYMTIDGLTAGGTRGTIARCILPADSSHHYGYHIVYDADAAHDDVDRAHDRSRV